MIIFFHIFHVSSRPSGNRDPASVSEADSDEENEEGDYTVYECPGLAPVSRKHWLWSDHWTERKNNDGIGCIKFNEVKVIRSRELMKNIGILCWYFKQNPKFQYKKNSTNYISYLDYLSLNPQTGEMEVKNPMFQDEATPASPATLAKSDGNV